MFYLTETGVAIKKVTDGGVLFNLKFCQINCQEIDVIYAYPVMRMTDSSQWNG